MLIPRRRLVFAVAAALAAVLFIFLRWYGGNGERLTSEEVDRYIQALESQSQEPGGRHDIPALRRFLEKDDGRPFYTVNLYKFNDHAQYPERQHPERTGREAFDHFSRVMLRLLGQRSSHPIFGSDWADAGSSAWDRIVVVRYRSRKDIVDLFATAEFAEASAHKWAALEDHERMLVQGLHIPELQLPAILLALVFTVTAFAGAYRSRIPVPRGSPRAGVQDR